MFAERVYFNSAYRSFIVHGHSVGKWLVKNGAKMKKIGSRNVGKEYGDCFSSSYDRVGSNYYQKRVRVFHQGFQTPRK